MEAHLYGILTELPKARQADQEQNGLKINYSQLFIAKKQVRQPEPILNGLAIFISHFIIFWLICHFGEFGKDHDLFETKE